MSSQSFLSDITFGDLLPVPVPEWYSCSNPSFMVSPCWLLTCSSHLHTISFKAASGFRKNMTIQMSQKSLVVPKPPTGVDKLMGIVCSRLPSTLRPLWGFESDIKKSASNNQTCSQSCNKNTSNKHEVSSTNIDKYVFLYIYIHVFSVYLSTTQKQTL